MQIILEFKFSYSYVSHEPCVRQAMKPTGKFSDFLHGLPTDKAACHAASSLFRILADILGQLDDVVLTHRSSEERVTCTLVVRNRVYGSLISPDADPGSLYLPILKELLFPSHTNALKK